MSRASAAEALAAAMNAVVADEVDVADVLAHLVADCVDVTSADAVALMAIDSQGDLALLAADSHVVTRLEILQIQSQRGPCVDVISSGRPVHVAGADLLVERWGEVGTAILAAGFSSVEAYPMRWQGRALGGLNVFHADLGAEPVGEAGQAFADMATVVVVQSLPTSHELVQARLHEALSARGVVEQAKGVLSYQLGLDLAAAYDELLRRACDSGGTLTRTALAVVEEACSCDDGEGVPPPA